MIPVAILIGILSGLTAGRRGWWAAGIVAVAWPGLLVATEVDSDLAFFMGAAALAAVNAIVGVAGGIAGRRPLAPIVAKSQSHA